MANLERMPKLKLEEQDKVEISPEKVESCRTALHTYMGLKPEEKILILTDKGTDPETTELFRQAFSGMNVTEISAEEKSAAKKINKVKADFDVAVELSYEPAKVGNFWDWFESDKNKKTRLLVLPGFKSDLFEEGGAMTEDPNELEERLNKMEAVLQDANGFRIKTSYGTDLKVAMRPYPFAGKQWIKCDGKITEPKQWDNWPPGEIFAVPDENKVEGTLVLPVLSELESEENFEQGVDEFVYVRIKNGMITTIDGGKSAEKLRKALEETAANEKIPWAALQIAEIAFGANSKAKGIVQDPEGPYTSEATPIVEAEKRLGTMHIAFGDNRLDPALRLQRYVEAESHLDFIIPRHGLTVEAFYGDKDFKSEKNGRKLIDQGSWGFYTR